mgnify:CR=1 FL=1
MYWIIKCTINDIKIKIDDLDNKFLEGKLDDDLYSKLARKLSGKLSDYERNLNNHKSEKVPFKKLLKNYKVILIEGGKSPSP